MISKDNINIIMLIYMYIYYKIFCIIQHLFNKSMY
jgi:hypothetical protein